MGRERFLEEKNARNNRSHDLMPDPGSTSDGYNLMMQSTGKWKPACAALNPSAGPGTLWEPHSMLPDEVRKQNTLIPQVAPDYAKLTEEQENQLFEPLNPTNARNEEDRREDQDYGFGLLQNKALNDTAVCCNWFSDSALQVPETDANGS